MANLASPSKDQLEGSDSNTVSDNICNNNRVGIELYESSYNIVANNTCNSNRIGIYLYESDTNTVVKNTCLDNAEDDIFLEDSDSNIVENNITTGFYSGLLLLGGVLFLLPLGIVVLGSRWHIASAIIQRTRYRLVFWIRKRKGDQDEIIVPTRYRLVSWLHERRSLKHVDVDETLEPESSDQ
jgi:parallel beta-helix repeat protein